MRKVNRKRSYDDDSRMMLLACVEDGDLWFPNTSLGEMWTTWSTKWPTEDGRNRGPSCVNAEFRLYKEEENWVKCALIQFKKCYLYDSFKKWVCTFKTNHINYSKSLTKTVWHKQKEHRIRNQNLSYRQSSTTRILSI